MRRNNEIPTVPGCVNGSYDCWAYCALQLTKPLFVPSSPLTAFWISLSYLRHEVPSWDRYVLNSWELLILNLLELSSILTELDSCLLNGTLLCLDGSCIFMVLRELFGSRIRQVFHIYFRYISLFCYRKSLKPQKKKSICHKYNKFLKCLIVREQLHHYPERQGTNKVKMA